MNDSEILVVDLDKSLIRTDYLHECLINYFSKSLLAPIILLMVIIRDGKIGLKKFLYKKSEISVKNLPYDEKVLAYIKNWKKEKNGKTFLVSASFENAVNDIAEYLDCFDGSYGTCDINLKSNNKLSKINEIRKNQPFTYIGDSYDDLVIWKDASLCTLVNPTKKLKNKVKKLNNRIYILDSKKNLFNEVFKTIRVHQWIKNCLLFVPAILIFENDYLTITNLINGFFAFSFVASAFYILNDLFDIENDRRHATKNKRSFASGYLSITSGLWVFIFLILFAVTIAFKLPSAFQLCLVLYAISTFLYSKYLKKIAIVDIFILSYLYLLRVLTGGVLISATISNWLLTFSVFFFLFLASVKRWIEIKKIDTDSIPGREYTALDISFIRQISYFSGLISVLIICLYIDSQQAQALYNSSKILWFIPAVLLYWILETLFKVERNEVDEDPVKYALKSKTSYICLFSFSMILFFSQI